MKHKWISKAIVLSALVWILYLFTDNNDLRSFFTVSLENSYLAFSIVPAMISVLFASYTYYLIISNIFPALPTAHNVMIHFAVSQFMRYMPGKVWGVFYQVSATAGSVPARYTVRANLEQLLLVYIYSIMAAISMLSYRFVGVISALALYLLMLFLFFICIRKSFVHWITSKIQRLRYGSIERFSADVNDNNKALLIVLFTQLEWFFYFLACALILPVKYSAGSVVTIAICYSTAWLVGMLAVISPGGLIVRETAFIWLSSFFGFNPVDMFTFSVLARILFTLNDIVCALLGMGLLMHYKKSSEKM